MIKVVLMGIDSGDNKHVIIQGTEPGYHRIERQKVVVHDDEVHQAEKWGAAGLVPSSLAATIRSHDLHMLAKLCHDIAHFEEDLLAEAA